MDFTKAFCIMLVTSWSLVNGRVIKNVQLIKGVQKNLTNGVEFSEISRGTLLKLLGTLADNLKARMRGENKKPLFAAQFINNKFTKPFIYPRLCDQGYSSFIYLDRMELTGTITMPSLILERHTGQDYEPKFWSRTTLIQMGYGIWVNQVLVALGLALGFSAVALPQLAELAAIGPKPPFKMEMDHEAWIASTLMLSSPIGCIVCGCLMDIVGRRTMMIFCVIPMAIGWLITGFSKNSIEMIIGRIVTGVGAGMCMSPPRAYCTEISLPRMRGVLGAFPTVALALGITIQATMGSFLQWKTLCYICGGHSIFLMLLNWFLPETPYFVLIKGTVKSAKEALIKFRAADHKIDQEFDEMRKFKVIHNIQRLSMKDTLKMIFSTAACQSFAIILGYVIFGQLAGVTVIMFYTVDILRESNSSINAFTGNIMLGMARLVGGILTSILIFKIRRRRLALTSAAGVGITCLILGFYSKFASEPSMIPQIGFVVYMLFATLGYLTLPMLMLFELVPMQIRGILGGMFVSATNIMVFGANSSYFYIKRALGCPITVIAFGFFSLIGFVYLFFFLPETRGLSLTEIEELFTYKHGNMEAPLPHELTKKSSILRHKESTDKFRIERAKFFDANPESLAELHIGSESVSADFTNLKRRKSSVNFIEPVKDDDENDTVTKTNVKSDDKEPKK